MSRAVRAMYWLAPIGFCLVVYWLGLRTWFAQDDFAWLNLRNHVTDFHTFLWAMFAPLAQGTIRPWSERGFFMAFSYFFGLHAMPYRIFVFLSQFVNIVLVMALARKLTKSDLAGLLAPVFWVANGAAFIIPMSWTSAYNEIQCATFLLLSFYLFLRYTETDEKKFYWGQWLTFVLGFGSLEINVVYPAIAALYAILFARRYFLSMLPMFAVSAVYTVVDRLLGPSEHDFYYDMDFHPGALFSCLKQYWTILLGVPAYMSAQHRPALGHAAVLVLTIALLGFIAWQAWQRRYLPLFFAGWFLIVLGPLLALHNHITDYYVYIPAIGVAMLAAHAMSLAWNRGWAPAAFAIVLAMLYLYPSVRNDRVTMRYHYHRADRARAVVQSVVFAKRIHPGKTILLKDVDDDTFWSTIFDSPFHIFGWNDIFVTPECRTHITDDGHFGSLDAYFLPASAVARALNDGSAVVYSVENRSLRNVTRGYKTFVDSQPAPGLSASIDLGVPYFKDQVGDGWYNVENGFRWSGKHSVVYLLGPTAAGQKLAVHGFEPEQQMKLGPLHFALTIDGSPQPVKTIQQAGFHLEYPLPADLIGRPKIEVAFTLDRTIRVPTDDRDLGLAFGEFAIR